MKLIIDIPEEKYNDILHTHMNMRSIVDNAIAMGIPIPDNATNGKVIMALFPNEHDFETDFDEDWWNSPYQKGGKNEVN